MYAKKKREAAKKGYYTDTDYYYGNVLGKSSPYEYRKKALENNVSEIDLFSPELTLTPGQRNFFHHLLIDPIHMNVAASGLIDDVDKNISYNILEIDALVSLQIQNTNSQLIGCNCYLIVCPAVYDYTNLCRLLNPNNQPVINNLKTSMDHYNEANTKLFQMLSVFHNAMYSENFHLLQMFLLSNPYQRINLIKFFLLNQFFIEPFTEATK